MALPQYVLQFYSISLDREKYNNSAYILMASVGGRRGHNQFVVASTTIPVAVSISGWRSWMSWELDRLPFYIWGSKDLIISFNCKWDSRLKARASGHSLGKLVGWAVGPLQVMNARAFMIFITFHFRIPIEASSSWCNVFLLPRWSHFNSLHYKFFSADFKS